MTIPKETILAASFDKAISIALDYARVGFFALVTPNETHNRPWRVEVSQ
ncbi:hypothetical protein LCGC14_2625960 [marine sediment metagenome]|uniref:Uncharacterized protein n=1 Tax=marine sediment metagenome TaxID=412755 RepID=A0A0F9A1M8_9ZZZZ